MSSAMRPWERTRSWLAPVFPPRRILRAQRASWLTCNGVAVPAEAKICGLTRSVDAELADAADALLIDAAVPGKLGGTGTPIPWLELGESLDAMSAGYRIVLAGGLTPENVAEAIDYVSPAVVDVSSGVESSTGIKDPQKV